MSAIPITRPNIDVMPRRSVRRRTYVSTRECTVWAVAFCITAFVTFGVSNLTGHVLIESNRRQMIQANQRLHIAVAAQNELSKEIEALANPLALQTWATRNGLVASDRLPQSSGGANAIVASR